MPSLIDAAWEGILTKVGDVMVRTSPPKIKACHIREAMKRAVPGMAICRKYNCYLDGLLIPGEYSHSGIIESANSVIHAVAEGVERIDIMDFVDGCDGFWMGLPTGNYDPKAAVCYARKQIGLPYDFNFKVEADVRTAKAMFCHKLTCLTLNEGGLRPLLVPEIRYFGPVAHEVFVAAQITGHPNMWSHLVCP